MIRVIILSNALASISTACGTPSPPSSLSNKGLPMTPTLAQRLQDDNFGPTFVWPQHDQTIARIWSEPGNFARLETLLDDHTAPTKARLLAAEALFKQDFSFLDRHEDKEVARIYTDALAQHTLAAANVWASCGSTNALASSVVDSSSSAMQQFPR